MRYKFKIKTAPSNSQRHIWFAWFPVLCHPSGEHCWLENVSREWYINKSKLHERNYIGEWRYWIID
jgi:hypothetical protein